MINRFRKVVNISQRLNNSNVSFNTNLPMSITVLEKLHNDKYKLLLGRKELTAKSKNKLNINKKYWGILKENNENILHISNLIQKPEIFNSNLEFIDIDDLFFFQILKEDEHPIHKIKQNAIEKMASDETTKEQFLTLGHILLAQSKGVFHFPMILNNKKVLLQFTAKDAISSKFYFAFENLGPIDGTITVQKDHTIVNLGAMFEKSYQLLKREFSNSVDDINITLKNDILPLFDYSEVLLDMKG